MTTRSTIKADLWLVFFFADQTDEGRRIRPSREEFQVDWTPLWEVERIRAEIKSLNERTIHTSDLLDQGQCQGTASCPPTSLVGSSFKISRFSKGSLSGFVCISCVLPGARTLPTTCFSPGAVSQTGNSLRASGTGLGTAGAGSWSAGIASAAAQPPWAAWLSS